MELFEFEAWESESPSTISFYDWLNVTNTIIGCFSLNLLPSVMGLGSGNSGMMMSWVFMDGVNALIKGTLTAGMPPWLDGLTENIHASGKSPWRHWASGFGLPSI